MKNIDKYRGCLIGGAAGDALGYAVEFLDENSIFRKYGTKGITEYELVNGIAQVSDDTQMTLFTANGLLLGTTRERTRGIMGTYPGYIDSCYKEWLKTQCEPYPLNERSPYSWLVNVPELFHQRAPGKTCLSALESSEYGTIEKPINHSKGCGGIMRVSPIGLYFGDKCYTIDQIDRMGAETAALTHGHELGYIPAAALVHILHLIAHHDDVTLFHAVLDMREAVCRQFPNAKHLQELMMLIDRAAVLSQENRNDREAIGELGQGWVAEETLAIALYCSLKYSDDFDRALIASVNHGGDSDSTGALTGNILGAYLGLEKIPQKYLRNLELKDVILELADDLFNDCQITEYGSYHDEIWEQKYIYKTYKEERKTEKSKEHTCEVILFPDFQKLNEDTRQLRTELTQTLLERDELKFVICPNIETQYILMFGSLEFKIYEAECLALRLRRKIELIQAKRNRQEKLVFSEIEEMLDAEFAQYQQKVNDKIDKMNEALNRSKAQVMSGEEEKEFKRLYRKAVKALHPDLNPEVTEAQAQLFANAVTAYKSGDLETLQIICEMITDLNPAESTEDEMSRLVNEKVRLEKLIKSMKAEIKKIKSEYPYSVKDLIEDEVKAEEQREQLTRLLSQYYEIIELYHNQINEMLRCTWQI